MVDLNTLIPAGSNLQLIDAVNINDRGEILVVGLPPGVEPSASFELGHLALLVACDGVAQSCEDDAAAAEIISAAASSQKAASIERPSSNRINTWREKLAQRFHVSGRD